MKKLTSPLLAFALVAAFLCPSIAQAKSEGYYVNIILERRTASDELWDTAWPSFRDTFLPNIQKGFTDGSGGKFDLKVNNQQAVFALTRLKTDDFAKTSKAFKSIPDSLPPIDEFVVIVDGPYRDSSGGGSSALKKKISALTQQYKDAKSSGENAKAASLKRKIQKLKKKLAAQK